MCLYAYIKPTQSLHDTYILTTYFWPFSAFSVSFCPASCPLRALSGNLFPYSLHILSLTFSQNSLENLMLTLNLINRQPVSHSSILQRISLLRLGRKLAIAYLYWCEPPLQTLRVCMFLPEF